MPWSRGQSGGGSERAGILTGRRSVVVLAVVFAAVVVSVVGLAVLQLYRIGLEHQRLRVAEVARSRAAFLAAVARFDRAESADFPGGSAAATLEQLRASHADFPGIGETGEYLVARRIGDSMAFEVPLRHAPDGSLDTLPIDGPSAEPMQMALSGQTGTMVGRDYRGETVLAAYRPVPELDLGLVAKIDVAEIRAPYVRTSFLAGGVGAGLIVVGVLVIGTIGGGLVSRLEAGEASLHEQERHLEDALERERMAGEVLKLALAAADQGVYDFDPRSGEVRVSPEFERMLGYRPGTMTMTPDAWTERLHPDDREAALGLFEAYMAGRRDRYESEFRMRGADGEYRWILSLGEIVDRDHEGRPTRFVGTHTDITHLKAVEEDLAAREAHLAEAQDLGRMGSWEIVPSLGRTWWSEGLHRILGLDPADTTPSPERFMELVHHDDLPAVQRAFDELLSESVPVEVEFRVEVRGQLRRMRGVGRPAPGDAEDRFLGVVKDVTEERTMEEMLRQAQKMEAVGQLTAGMAHDFNNLLTTILANSDLGLTEMEAEGDGGRGALERELREIRRAARQGRDLIRQLMIFSRDQRLRMRHTDMSRLVRDMADLLRRALPASVELSIEAPDEPLMAFVDRGAVHQVVLNLVNNARDAMPRGGSFILSADRVEAAEVEPELDGGPHVRMRASDTGHGMSDDVLERVFEPFFTTKPVGEGTGLGLAMVYGLMQRQGGTVRVSTESGVGTTVSLFFPLVAESSTEGELEIDVPEGAGAVGSARRILVVEDEPALRRIARRILDRAGYRVLEAETGLDAIEILEGSEESVELIVSDVVMPGLGGVELLERCRSSGIEIPFLFMSGYAEVELGGGTGSGEPSFLPKPWTADELLAAVEKALDGDSSGPVTPRAPPRR